MPTNPPADQLGDALQDLIRYRKEHLRGEEKGEAAIFLENLFRALGHEGFARPYASLRDPGRNALRNRSIAEQEKDGLTEPRRPGNTGLAGHAHDDQQDRGSDPPLMPRRN